MLAGSRQIDVVELFPYLLELGYSYDDAQATGASQCQQKYQDAIARD
jgi:hypothetical protein